jgi:hypothetical protein
VLPSLFAGGCGPAPGTIDDAFNQVGALASCVVAANPGLNTDITILNVFLPPATAPSSPTADFCQKHNGQHDKYGSPVAVTVTPTHPACNGNVTAVFQTVTHEMTEATTDPNPKSPTGWKTCCNPVEEVADQCESSPSRFVNFMFGRVSTYFSDSANNCTPGFAMTTPKIVTANVCGIGSRMRMTLTGAFGAPPWDLTTIPASYPAPASSRTLYLNAKITGANTWSVGNFAGFPADGVGFGKITWTLNGGTSDTIVIEGFDQHYGIGAPNGSVSIVSPGDTITFTLFSPNTGQSTSLAVPVPAVGTASVSGLKAVPTYFWLSQSWLSYGEPLKVQGALKTAAGCAVEGATVTISSNDPSPDVVQAATLSDGSFSADYKFAGHAGNHTLKTTTPVAASAPVTIHPNADYLSATMGAVAGHQPVTLSGHGIDFSDGGYAAGATTVIFRSGSFHANATAVAVPDASTVTFSTPPSPLPGSGAGKVDVVASIGGAESTVLKYTYLIPDQPILTALAPNCPWDSNKLQVDAYKADGSDAAEQVGLTGNYAAFVVGNNAVASTTVTSGSSIALKGPGPLNVTATPASNPALAVKLTVAFQPASSACLPPQIIAYQFQPVLGPGPVESVAVNPVYGLDGKSVVWTMPTNSAQSLSYVMLTGADRAAVAAAAAVDVSVVGSRALAGAVKEKASAYAHEGHKAGHVRFLGPSFALQFAAPAHDALVRSPAILSFGIPDETDTSAHAVMLLAPGADSWIEVPSFVDRLDRSVALRAKVTARGIYALAQLEE